jgi:hypothetical protein
MFKRLLLIGLLCVGLIALVNSEAGARCRIVSGKLVCTEVCALTSLEGVGNPEIKPVAVCVGLHIGKVSGRCWNSPYNAKKTQGTVFFPDISLTGSTFVTAYDLTGERGEATTEICWASDWEGIKALVQPWINSTYCSNPDDPPVCVPKDCEYDPYNPNACKCYCPGDEVCPNPNWWLDQFDWTIQEVYVYHSSYQYAQDGMTLTSTDKLCKKCTLGGTECGFTCTTVNVGACQGLISECESCIEDPGCYYTPES